MGAKGNAYKVWGGKPERKRAFRRRRNRYEGKTKMDFEQTGF
jgi:hypothetical protein